MWIKAAECLCSITCTAGQNVNWYCACMCVVCVVERGAAANLHGYMYYILHCIFRCNRTLTAGGHPVNFDFLIITLHQRTSIQGMQSRARLCISRISSSSISQSVKVTTNTSHIPHTHTENSQRNHCYPISLYTT